MAISADQRTTMPDGTVLVATYKDKQYRCTVKVDGEGKRTYKVGNKSYGSPSTAARDGVTNGVARNGWTFWTLETEAKEAAEAKAAKQAEVAQAVLDKKAAKEAEKAEKAAKKAADAEAKKADDKAKADADREAIAADKKATKDKAKS